MKARSLLPLLLAIPLLAAEPVPTPPGNAMLADYFQRQVAEIENTPLSEPKSAEDWEKMRQTWRKQFADMLGLDPMPPRTPLNAQKTGEQEGDGFIVENLHFQSMPGLYVTANFYRPAKIEGKLPTILYVCGHSNMFGKDGTSLGNKAGYEHHGVWYARHGYTCLIIDTVQLGEIRGEHHGTYDKGRWWWISRGYTPAGVEAWNGIRALDYLETRPEVDMQRIGIAGRSGGGAYSWWIAALDDRIKVAVPTAGITTLRNHVVDGCVEGHCDCMYMVNTYRWDYDKVAALVAPRPLLIANTDKDGIFPLDGVISVYTSVRKLYKSLGAEGKIGLQIAEGPHKDTQALNTGEFAWFERWLKGADLMATFDEAAKKTLDPEKLRVFSTLPADERNTRIDEQFVPMAAEPPVPANPEERAKQRDAMLAALKRECFAAWPQVAPDLALRDLGILEKDGIAIQAWDFTPQEPWRLRLYVVRATGLQPANAKIVGLNVFDAQAWSEFCATMPPEFAVLFPTMDRAALKGINFDELAKTAKTTGGAMAYVAPRGVGPTAWSGSEKQQAQRLRRFYLLGQTLDSMQVWDIRRAIAAVRSVGFADTPLRIDAERVMAGNALYASLFEERIAQLSLDALPSTHAQGPIYLNVLRILDMRQALAMASARTKLEIIGGPNPMSLKLPR